MWALPKMKVRVCFTDVAGMPSLHEASDTSSYTSSSSDITAEELIRCASETAALKHLSDSLLLSNDVKTHTEHAEIPCRDNEIEGAEDSQQSACEGSVPVGSKQTERNAESMAIESSIAAASSYAVAPSLPQKTVAVAALMSGVYITKPAQPTDNKSSVIEPSYDADTATGDYRRDDKRRLQFTKKQFPILHDLSQRPQQS